MENIIRISFVGDIMCEKPLLEAARVGNDEYDFNDVFSEVEETFKKSDYVVGNLETICAGKNLGYTNHIFSFNTPESFLEAIKKSGIDLLTTATNHCLDRGIEGLKKNLVNLKKYNLDSIGTYATREDSEKIFYKDFNGLKVAFLNYTYGTNTQINEEVLEENELFHVNLLKPQDEDIEKLKIKKHSKKFKSILARNLFKILSLEQWIKLKRFLGLKYYSAYQDNNIEGINNDYLKKIASDIKHAKTSADIVIVCMHSGGQFNAEPGKFSKYMMNFMSENDVDVVVGNHPHVVQKHEKFSTGMLGAYSLGNFSISPSSVYILDENLPEYSIMLHLYLDNKNKQINKTTFSILKIVESKNGMLKVYPIDKLFEILKTKKEREKIISDATIIYNRFMNTNVDKVDILKEYEI